MIAGLGAVRHGVMTGQHLRSQGVGWRAIEHQCDRGLLIRLARDVFRLRDHPWTFEARLQALLVEVGPGSFASHRSAARLHGFWSYRTNTAIEVTGKELGNHRVTLGRLHRSSLLHAEYQTVVAGLPVSTVARTCFDLMGDPEPGLRRSPVGLEIHARNMLRVVNDALSGDLTLGQLVALRVSMCRRGRPGSTLAREVVDRLSSSYVPTTTDGEHLFAELVDLCGLPQPRRQVPISGDHGFIGTVDFLYDDARLVIEIDGKTHERPLDRESDAIRDAEMEAAGYVVWRIPYLRLVRGPEAVMRELQTRRHASTA